jgi:serine protease Do
MNARQLVFVVLLLSCGFAMGLVLVGGMRTGDDALAQTPARGAASQPAAGATVPRTAPRTAPVPAAATVADVPAAPAATMPDFTRIAERTVPAVVNISSRQVVRRPNSPFATDPFFQEFFGTQGRRFSSRVESSLGSGVIVSSDGYVLTNNHVVTGDSRQRVSLRSIDITVTLSDKREMPAQVVGIDPDTDLALLKLDAEGLPTIPWGDSQRLKVAEWVLAIGNPYQLSETVTLGIVSAVNRQDVGINAYEDFVQTDAAINPGNSGGALVNSRGELVGINTAIFSQSGGYQGIGFAVASNLARLVQDDLQRFGEVRRGTIGYVQVAPLTTRWAAELRVPDARGIIVADLPRDTAAFQGGLRPLDVVIAFNGAAVTDGAQLRRLVQDAPIGSTAEVTVIRQGRRVELRIPILSTAG